LLLAATGKQQTCQRERKERSGSTIEIHSGTYDPTF
jgi:hypothetical protein